jgi:hypothetical protein
MEHGVGIKASSIETNEAASKICPTSRFSLDTNRTRNSYTVNRDIRLRCLG